MSRRARPLTYVIRHALCAGSPYTPTERLVLVALAAHCDFDTDCAFLTLGTLANATGLSRRTLQRTLASLLDRPDALFAATRPGSTSGHPHRCPRYTLVRPTKGVTMAPISR